MQVESRYATIKDDEVVRLDPCDRCKKVRKATRDTNEGYILEHGEITMTIGDTEVLRYFPPVGIPVVCDRCEDEIIAKGRFLTVKALEEYDTSGTVTG